MEKSDYLKGIKKSLYIAVASCILSFSVQAACIEDGGTEVCNTANVESGLAKAASLSQETGVLISASEEPLQVDPSFGLQEFNYIKGDLGEINVIKQGDNIAPVAYGRGLYANETSTGRWQIFYLNGATTTSASNCRSDTTPFRLVVRNNGVEIARSYYFSQWSATLSSGGTVYCGSPIMNNVNTVGLIGAVTAHFETTAGGNVQTELANRAACERGTGMQPLYALRNPLTQDFKMANNEQEYDRSRKKGGYTDVYGIIGQFYTKQVGPYSVPLHARQNPVVNTHAYSTDLTEFAATHPAWRIYDNNMPILGYIFTQQLPNTKPLYRGYQLYSDTNWEVGYTTDYQFFLNMMTQEHWTPYGTPGHPMGVIGYVCN